MTTAVPPGVSGRPPIYDTANVTIETIANELALLNLGDFEPLNIKIDINRYNQELQPFEGDWVEYLPRTDRANNRKAMVLTHLEGRKHNEAPSLAECSYAAGRRLSELEFSHRTPLYDACTSLHPLLDEFAPLGRSFIIQSNIGGYFVPHRDHPSMPRESFRLVCFLRNCAPLQYDWLIDTDRKLQIEEGRVYYVNTRKTHRTISWVNDSQHLILNVPMTNDNVAKVLAHLQHPH
jgi:hypothetical protein